MLKVVCHMITTPNGYIARVDGSSVSGPLDWQEFSKGVKQHNNFVAGRKTLDAVGERGFAGSECDYRIVVSAKKDLELNSSLTVVYSPQEAIAFLQDKVDTLFLVGGSELNAAFAKLGLIDEITLIIEPPMIGNGVNLFAPSDFELPLSYKGVEELEGGRLKIKYRVQK